MVSASNPAPEVEGRRPPRDRRPVRRRWTVVDEVEDRGRARPGRRRPASEPAASPIGVRGPGAYRVPCAAPAAGRAAATGATLAVETRSARIRRDPPAARPRATRSRWTTETLPPNGLGCTKWTPPMHRVAHLAVRVAHDHEVGPGRQRRPARPRRSRRRRRSCRRSARPSIPLCTRATDDVGVPPHRLEHRRRGRPRSAPPGPVPPSWSRSQTITPGVVKPVIAMRTPCRCTHAIGRVAGACRRAGRRCCRSRRESARRRRRRRRNGGPQSKSWLPGVATS